MCVAQAAMETAERAIEEGDQSVAIANLADAMCDDSRAVPRAVELLLAASIGPCPSSPCRSISCMCSLCLSVSLVPLPDI